jgi:hypothetical protein
VLFSIHRRLNYLLKVCFWGAKDSKMTTENTETTRENAETTREEPWISEHDVNISGNYSVIKAIIALIQLYSIVVEFLGTQMEDRQITHYSSYQLTMIYGLMSLLNILCGIVTPSYTAVYMVENSVMRDAIRRGGVFDGVVGELAEDLAPDEHGKFRVMILEGSAQNETTQLPLTEPPAARSGQKKPYSTSAILMVDWYPWMLKLA